MKVCHFCGNKNFRDVSVQYTYRHEDKFLIVDDVPCTQCEFCGEQYYEARVLKQIESEFNAIHNQGKKVEKEVVVPVESYNEIKKLAS